MDEQHQQAFASHGLQVNRPIETLSLKERRLAPDGDPNFALFPNAQAQLADLPHEADDHEGEQADEDPLQQVRCQPDAFHDFCLRV